MKVKALRTGKFAFADPARPQMQLISGVVYIVDDAMGKTLAEVGWAEPYVEPPAETEPEPDEKPKKKKTILKKKATKKADDYPKADD